MRWGVNSQAGWYDLDRGIFYRRGEGQHDTKKRRTPAPIPVGLVPHLKRWRKLTTIGPCEIAHPVSRKSKAAGMMPEDARITLRQKTGFAIARKYAGLGPDVNAHVLKHTGITWLMQAGVPIWEVSGFTGTSEKMIRDVYGHHSPDSMPAARLGFRGRNVGGQIPRSIGANG